jgi:hypothetical protein
MSWKYLYTDRLSPTERQNVRPKVRYLFHSLGAFHFARSVAGSCLNHPAVEITKSRRLALFAVFFMHASQLNSYRHYNLTLVPATTTAALAYLITPFHCVVDKASILPYLPTTLQQNYHIMPRDRTSTTTSKQAALAKFKAAKNARLQARLLTRC